MPAVPARLVSFDALPGEIQRGLRQSRDAWSAIGYGRSPVDGHDLILLNPDHHEHRKRASLMEELVHIILDHPKVPLSFNGQSGRWRRPFEKAVEDEAFNVGAACIIPYKPLFNAVKNEGSGLDEIAASYGVSTEYVRFRINRAGLYRVFKKACS